MFRLVFLAAAFAVLAPAPAQAQYYGGPIPNSGNDVGYVYGGIASYYAHRKSPEELAREREIEFDYRKALTTIPDRKGSSDPWKGMRHSPDRHTMPQ